jgi:hypothetical protein
MKFEPASDFENKLSQIKKYILADHYTQDDLELAFPHENISQPTDPCAAFFQQHGQTTDTKSEWSEQK